MHSSVLNSLVNEQIGFKTDIFACDHWTIMATHSMDRWQFKQCVAIIVQWWRQLKTVPWYFRLWIIRRGIPWRSPTSGSGYHLADYDDGGPRFYTSFRYRPFRLINSEPKLWLCLPKFTCPPSDFPAISLPLKANFLSHIDHVGYLLIRYLYSYHHVFTFRSERYFPWRFSYGSKAFQFWR